MIKKKVQFLTYKLTPIRLVKDLRININLFKLFCLPQFRMGYINLKYVNNGERNIFKKTIRSMMKQFCLLPFNLPNRLLVELFGNIDETIDSMIDRTKQQLDLRTKRVIPDPQEKVSLSKLFPMKLTEVLKNTY